MGEDNKIDNLDDKLAVLMFGESVHDANEHKSNIREAIELDADYVIGVCRSLIMEHRQHSKEVKKLLDDNKKLTRGRSYYEKTIGERIARLASKLTQAEIKLRISETKRRISEHRLRISDSDKSNARKKLEDENKKLESERKQLESELTKSTVPMRTNLREEILFDPVEYEDADTLKVLVYGAWHETIDRHLCELPDYVEVDLLLGSKGIGGQGKTKTDKQKDNDKKFAAIQEKNVGRFNWNYTSKKEDVHLKLYIWCKGEDPLIAYSGSANYTDKAFDEYPFPRELMFPTDPKVALKMFNELKEGAHPPLMDLTKSNQQAE